MTAKLTPAEVAKDWGISVRTVFDWINSGRLRAVNVSRNPRSRRPRYRIDPADLQDFERTREVGTPKPAPQRRRNKPDVIEFY